MCAASFLFAEWSYEIGLVAGLLKSKSTGVKKSMETLFFNNFLWTNNGCFISAGSLQCKHVLDEYKQSLILNYESTIN